MPSTDPPPTPKPLAELDTAGQPTKLSYNVPDPTSYPGRAFVNLEIRPEWFKPSVVEAAAPPSARLLETRGEGDGGSGMYEVITDDGVYRIEDGDGVLEDAALRPVDRPALSALREAGREPRFYRTLYGDLAVVPITAEVDDDNPSKPYVPAVLWLGISAPSPGTIQQPGQVNLTLQGGAGILEGTGSIGSVDVKVGDADYQPAESQDGWATWSYSETFTTSRTVEITVQAAHDSSYVTTRRTITLNIVVLPGQPPDDATPPNVTITVPQEDEIFKVDDPNAAATVVVRGSATDNEGVEGVVVKTADGEVTAEAIPKAPDDWSEWSAELSLPTGRRRLIAQCVDASENMATADVNVVVSTKPKADPIYTRLMLVEQYRLSNFLGSFGAGRTLKTFSLIPGEKAKVRISTYRRTEKTAKSATSILDSFTSESSREFQKSVEREQQYKQNFQESFDYNVSGGAQATWAWGSASVEGGVSGGTNATREEFAKNLTNAVEKHAAKASAKREVQVETSLEEKVAEGEETALEREFENINLSRTLNFVFRGLNQMYWSILHLVDCRIAYARAYKDENGVRRLDYREVTLSQLDSLLREVIVESHRPEVYEAVIAPLKNIADHQDLRQDFTEVAGAVDENGDVIPGTTYLRCKTRLESTFVDEKTGFKTEVDGIILRATSTVMRTDGVIVEAVLGQGEALDTYSKQLQDEAARVQQLANQEMANEIEREKLGLEIVRTNNADMAKLYEQIYESGPVPASAQPTRMGVTDGQRDESSA